MPNNEIKQIAIIQTDEEDYDNDFPAQYLAIYQCRKCKEVFTLAGSNNEIYIDEQKKNHNCNA